MWGVLVNNIRDQENDIIDSTTEAKWVSVSRNLGDLDLEECIEDIDDGILRSVNEANETSFDRKSAMEDDGFRENVMQFFEDELSYLMLVAEYDREKDMCRKVISNP